MAFPAQKALDAVAKHLGVDVEVTPLDGTDPFTVKAWPEGETELSGVAWSRNQRDGVVLIVRVSEWAAPKKGDTLVAYGETRVLGGAPDHPDPLRLAWRLDTEPV